MHFVRELQDGAPAFTFKGDCSPAGPSSKLLGSAGRALVPLQLELNDRVLTHPIKRPLSGLRSSGGMTESGRKPLVRFGANPLEKRTASYRPKAAVEIAIAAS